MNGASANVVKDLGHIHQKAKQVKGTNHPHGLFTGQAFEELFQCLVCALIAIAAKHHQQLANLFDKREDLGPFWFADHVPRYRSQQASVCYQKSPLSSDMGLDAGEVTDLWADCMA